MKYLLRFISILDEAYFRTNNYLAGFILFCMGAVGAGIAAWLLFAVLIIMFRIMVEFPLFFTLVLFIRPAAGIAFLVWSGLMLKLFIDYISTVEY